MRKLVITNNKTYFKFRIIQSFFRPLNMTGNALVPGELFKPFSQKGICFCKLKLTFLISCFATA